MKNNRSNTKAKIKKSIILLTAICSVFLSGCSILNPDNVSYDLDPITGTIVDSREEISHVGGGVVIHHYYVTIEAEDRTKTEFESSSLYDTYTQNTGKLTIDYYKLTEYQNECVVKTTYQLTDEIPAIASSTKNTIGIIEAAIILIILGALFIFIWKIPTKEEI